METNICKKLEYHTETRTSPRNSTVTKHTHISLTFSKMASLISTGYPEGLGQVEGLIEYS